MNTANVLLVTSYWDSPNVVKEAMAYNLPIISTDVGDVKEIIHDSYNCFIVGFSKEEISEKLKINYERKECSNGREKIRQLKDDLIAQKIIRV